MRFLHNAAIGCALALAETCVAAAQGATPPPGVIIARTGADALVIWNATAFAESSTEESRSTALHKLEAAGVERLAITAPMLRNSKTVTVRIVMNQSGAISPVYKVATFEGIAHVADITMPTELLRHSADISANIAKGTRPQGVRISEAAAP